MNDSIKTVTTNSSDQLSKRQRDWPLVLLAVANGLAIALVLFLIAVQPSPKPLIDGAPDFMTLPTAGPYLGYSGDALDPEVGQIAIISQWQRNGNELYRAFDLAKETMLWSISVPPVKSAFATAGYLVIQTADSLRVVRAQTGRTVAEVEIMADEELIAAQAGIALTVQGGAYICARSLADAHTCLWQANAIQIDDSAVIFGDGSWVNTDDGVLDLLTGQPAPFGSDVARTADRLVYYLGSTHDRVFRYEQEMIDSDLTGPHLQVWDIQNDRAIGSAMPGSDVVADASGSTFVTTRTESARLLELTGYSWGSGAQLWQTTLEGASLTGSFCSNALVVTTTSSYANPDNAAIVNLETGAIALSVEGRVLTTGDQVAYLGGAYGEGPLTAYSCEKPNAAPLWSIKMSYLNVWGIAGHLLLSGSSGIYVLHEPA